MTAATATTPELAAWEVAVSRGMNISRLDIRKLLLAAKRAESGSEQINRLVVVDYRASTGKPGRSLDVANVDTCTSVRDSGRTLKVFITDRKAE